MPDAGPVLLATGGTAGHVMPALALAARLRDAGVRVAFTGQTGAIEQELAIGAGFEFHGTTTGKLDRQRPNPLQLLRAARGLFQALGVLRRVNPKLLIGFGGFASLPATAAASLLRAPPLWLHEQNAWPGLVTRMFARRAERVIIAVEAARTRINAREVTHVPFPVDETVLPRAEARSLLGLPADGTLTLVTGGSQGSVALNDAVLTALRGFGADAPLTLHGTGRAHLDSVLSVAADLPRHHPVGWFENAVAWSAADLAITRAGTGTLSMAALHGVPLIMVPLPTSAENHQHHNAAAVAAAGGGTLLPQDDLADLDGLWRNLLDDAERQAAGAAIARLSPAGAAERLANLVLARLDDGSATLETE